MNFLPKVAVATAITLFSVSVLAQPTPQEQAERANDLRQSVFKLLSSNNGPLRAMGRGDIPVNAALAEKAATRVSQLSLMITDYFAFDTRAFDLETEALPVIWEEPDAFAEKAMNLTQAADAVLAAVASGDEAAIKQTSADLGQNCGGCHQDFRLDD